MSELRQPGGISMKESTQSAMLVFRWLVIGVLQALYSHIEVLPSVEFGDKRKTELQIVPYNNEH